MSIDHRDAFNNKCNIASASFISGTIRYAPALKGLQSCCLFMKGEGEIEGFIPLRGN